MMRILQRAILLAAVLAPAMLRADVTVRYKNDFQFASFLPAATLPANISPMQLSVMRLKGSKAYADLGSFASIIDVASGEITLIDRDHKRFAKAPYQDYANQMEAALAEVKPALSPDARKALDSMKSSVAMRKTGRTEVIQGVQAEETEMTISIEMALDLPQSGPAMRAVMRIWGARPEEALRVPAVRQLAGYSAYHSAAMNPFELMEKAFANMPGISPDFATKLRELATNTPMLLKSNVEMYAPVLVQLMEQMQKQGLPVPEGFDPKAPLMRMSTEIAELSVDEIDDSVFEVPDGFEPASFDDVLKGITAPATAAGAGKARQ